MVVARIAVGLAASPKNPRAASRHTCRRGRAHSDTRHAGSPHHGRSSRTIVWSFGLVHPELPRPLQFRRQAVDHAPEVERRVGVGKGRTVQIDARAGEDLRLAIAGGGPLLRPAAPSAPSIRRAGAGAWVTPSSQARQAYFGDGDDHPSRERCRAGGAIFADANHLAATARVPRSAAGGQADDRWRCAAGRLGRGARAVLAGASSSASAARLRAPRRQAGTGRDGASDFCPCNTGAARSTDACDRFGAKRACCPSGGKRPGSTTDYHEIRHLVNKIRDRAPLRGRRERGGPEQSLCSNFFGGQAPCFDASTRPVP